MSEGKSRSGFLDALKNAQAVKGYLSEEDIKAIAAEYGMFPSEVYETATFYTMLQVGAKALPISTPVEEPVDILFLGNSYYAFTIDPAVRDFIRSLNKDKVGKIVNFGSAAMLNSTYKKVKAEADQAGIPMDEREFHCKGEFMGIHKGRPDKNDMKAAADFARKIIG